MKVYFIETSEEGKITFMSTDHSQRHKMWVERPKAKEIPKKMFEDLKYEYEQTKKHIAQ